MHELSQESLAVFKNKGTQGADGIPNTRDANAVKVRRIMQIMNDLSNRPLDQLRVLELACGEGVYSIEAAIHGCNALASDGRMDRMSLGMQVAEREGLETIEFVQRDVRTFTKDEAGEFDVVLFLGILYHLDVPDSITTFESIYEMCTDFLIIDTRVATAGVDEFSYKGRTYRGRRQREHADHDTAEQRLEKLLDSLDNTFSFWFTPESLTRLLLDVGFTSVFQCHAPLETFKPKNRITVVAKKSHPVRISTYPWINDKSEEEIDAVLRPSQEQFILKDASGGGMKGIVKRVLRRLGYEVGKIAD